MLSFNAAQDTIIEICRNCSYQEGILEHSINVQKCVTTALNTNVIKNLKNNYLREVPIAGILGNNKYSGYIDLLVKNTDHYLIVDYKTDTIDSKNTIDKKNEIYSNQLAIYSALLKKTFQTIRVRALFLFLNSPDIVEFEIQNLESIENEIIKSYI